MPQLRWTSLLLASLLAGFLLTAAGCRKPQSGVPEDTGAEAFETAAGAGLYVLSREEQSLSAFRAGMEAELAGEADIALECYRLAVELEPGEGEYHARLGLLLASLKRGGAGKHLIEASRLGSGGFTLLQALANHYIGQGRGDLAAMEFEKMLTCRELSDAGRIRQGAVLRLAFFLISHYSRVGRPADAARIAEFLSKRYPHRPEFHLERAKHLLAAGLEATALEEALEFEKMLPGSTAAARMLAMHYSDKELYAEALAQVDRAMKRVRLDPGASAGELTRLRYFRADLLGKLKRYSDARRELQTLLAGSGDDGEKVDALVAIAHLDRVQGESSRAARRMQGALASGIRSGRLYGMMAGSFEDLGRFEQAARAYRMAQQLSPRDTGYRLSLARLFERRGRRAQAAGELRAALRISPAEPSCASYLAYLYALEGINLKEAGRLAAIAMRTEPRNGTHMAVQGWVLYRQGRVDDARKILERAALLAPRSATFEHLGDACFALGLWRRAKYAWGRALKMEPGRDGVERRLERIGELAPR